MMKMMLTDPSGLLAEMLSLSTLLTLLKVFPAGRVGEKEVVERMGTAMSMGTTGFGVLKNIPTSTSGSLEKIVRDLLILILLGQSQPSVVDWPSSRTYKTLIQIDNVII